MLNNKHTLVLSSRNYSKYSSKKKTLIVIHLYYLDTINNYTKYIKIIPDECDVLFTASSKEHHEKLRSFVKDKKNWQIIDKNNRGRDISAFLVAGREIIQKYDYVCFVHDKKAKIERNINDFKEWTNSLWKNSIGSSAFIYNVLNEFEKEKKLGMLIPPAPLGEHCDAALENAWYGNYGCTVQLAKELEVTVPIYRTQSPLSLGTVFWARVKALDKLLNREWKYADFPPEPLPADNVISYAVERILSFIVQDAGYNVKVVMSEEYISTRYEKYERIARNSLKMFREHGIQISSSDICKYQSPHKKLYKFLEKCKRLYVYGAGVVGRRCYQFLKTNLIFPDNFLVTEKDYVTEVDGLKVEQFSNIHIHPNDGIIIATSQDKQNEIINHIFKINSNISLKQIFKWR